MTSTPLHSAASLPQTVADIVRRFARETPHSSALTFVDAQATKITQTFAELNELSLIHI